MFETTFSQKAKGGFSLYIFMSDNDFKISKHKHHYSYNPLDYEQSLIFLSDGRVGEHASARENHTTVIFACSRPLDYL